MKAVCGETAAASAARSGPTDASACSPRNLRVMCRWSSSSHFTARWSVASRMGAVAARMSRRTVAGRLMARKSRTVVRGTCELDCHRLETVLGGEGDHGAPEVRIAHFLGGTFV